MPCFSPVLVIQSHLCALSQTMSHTFSKIADMSSSSLGKSKKKNDAFTLTSPFKTFSLLQLMIFLQKHLFCVFILAVLTEWRGICFIADSDVEKKWERKYFKHARLYWWELNLSTMPFPLQLLRPFKVCLILYEILISTRFILSNVTERMRRQLSWLLK